MDIAPAPVEHFAQSTGSIPTPGNMYFYGLFYSHMIFLRVLILLHQISNAHNRKNVRIIFKFFHRNISNVHYGIIMGEGTTAPSVHAPFLGDISLSKPSCG